MFREQEKNNADRLILVALFGIFVLLLVYIFIAQIKARINRGKIQHIVGKNVYRKGVQLETYYIDGILDELERNKKRDMALSLCKKMLKHAINPELKKYLAKKIKYLKNR